MVYFSLNVLVGNSNAPIISLVQIDPFKAFCAIWYHLRNLTNVENTQGGVLLFMEQWPSG